MKSLLLVLLSAAGLAGVARADVTLTHSDDRIVVEIDGKPFTAFYISGAELTKPYLHPLRAASGTYVTRMWPMQEVGNEPTDHKHQRGLWFAHAKVNDLDFWNNEASYTTPNRGKITLEPSIPVKMHGGKQQGTITATFNWTDLAGNKLLTESRTMTFRAGPVRIIDFDFTLTAVARVVFHDEKDGLFGLRLRPDLQEDKGSGHIANAEGLATEKQVWGKPSNWVDYSGEVNGEKLGIAIFDHPKNTHRARWHARAYGLFAANPFGMAAFTRDKSQDGSLALEPGQKAHFRYRVVIHSGDTASAGLPALWEQFVK